MARSYFWGGVRRYHITFLAESLSAQKLASKLKDLPLPTTQGFSKGQEGLHGPCPRQCLALAQS